MGCLVMLNQIYSRISQGMGLFVTTNLPFKQAPGMDHGESYSTVRLSPGPGCFKINPFTFRAVKSGEASRLLLVILMCSCIQISTKNVNHTLHAEWSLTEVVGSKGSSTIQSRCLWMSER